MNALKDLLENLKERISSLIAEQQESELYIKLKDKYEELPLHMQRVVKYFSILFVSLFILWLPFTSIFDSIDQNIEFDDRRTALKDFLKLQREFSSLPQVPTPPAPMTLKGAIDQKIMAQGVTQGQIKEASEDNKGSMANVELKGIKYHLQHVTIKQALNIAYEIEQVDKSLHIADVELIAEQKDPHYYELKLRAINYSPKLAAQAAANAK